MSYNAEREREREREREGERERNFVHTSRVYVCTYTCINLREMEKGRNKIFPLTCAHARSIVPAGGHFVLARRPGVPDDPGKILANDSL